MRIKKKIISIILSFFIIFSNSLIGQVKVKAAEDTTPPTLNSVTINKNIGTSGDILTVTVNSQDDISGISYVSISYAHLQEVHTRVPRYIKIAMELIVGVFP